MHKLFLRLALVSVAFVPAASALAADLDMEVAPPPPPVTELRPATYDWTGLYVGAWAGATCIDGFLTDRTTQASNDADADPTNDLTYEWEKDGCGAKGGLMAGYLHQFDSFVLGAEVDWGMTGEVARNDTPTADFAFKMNHLVTGRLRAGYAFDDTLLYATGGIAWAQGDLYGVNGHPIPDHINADHMGWTVGGGIEHAMTDALRLRLEYTYTRFGGENYSDSCLPAACNLDISDFDDHEIKVGAIWAF
jgi:outer membrane immunogenic protein